MKTCLVICPFGEPNSKTRNRSDFVFENYIEPAAKAEGYKAYRSIDDEKPGVITSRIIKDIYEVDLVIADLTELNPNVFYELALRHSTGKPYIHISETLDKIPFDIAGMSVIQVRKDFDVKQGDKAKGQLRKQIKQAEKDQTEFENPAWRIQEKQVGKVSTRGYTWEIQYTCDMADKWLARQKRSVRKAAEDFRHRGWPNDESLKERVGEYLTYQAAQTRVAQGQLYYTTGTKTEHLDGLGFVQFLYSGNMAAFRINGWEKPDGRLLIKYSQAPQEVKLFGEDIPIRGFLYTINYVPDPETQGLKGDLYHPDFPTPAGKRVLVATTTLIPM